VQNYPLLKGVQTNLYKCFMPIGLGAGRRAQAWPALLHPRGRTTTRRGGALREAMYRKTAAHFQFTNELQLFPDWGSP
jgi:hypothetical protein